MRLNNIFSTATVVAVLLSISAPLHAAGSSSRGSGTDPNAQPPAQTQTTQSCFDARQWDPDINKYVRFSEKVNGVWDPQLKRCIRPDKAGYLQSSILEDAVRELAYFGRLTDAQTVLSQMDADSDFALTYWGFTHRKLGQIDEANAYYQAAIEKNPDNILARSYMGQGFVEAGDYLAAREQLLSIRARGGQNTWAEASLLAAIETGTGYSY